MKKIIRVTPVFYSLLSWGMILLILAMVFRYGYALLEYKCLYPIGLGTITGALVSYIETAINKHMKTEKYQPTEIPIAVFYIMFILYMVLQEYKLWLLFMSSSYFFSLAIAFRIYEKRIGKIGIKWNELNQKK